MKNFITVYITKIIDGVEATRLIVNNIDSNDPANTHAYLHAIRIVLNNIVKELCDLEEVITEKA